MPDVVTIAPAEEPVSLDEAKAHCRIDGADEDDVVSALIVAARRHCEAQTRRSFVTQTRRLTAARFPRGTCPIRLAAGPVQSVTSVAYVDAAGTAQTLSPSLYQTDLAGPVGLIYPAVDEVWPDFQEQVAAVTVTYVAGFGAATAVPQEIKQAMLLLIGHWYDQRQVSVVGAAVAVLPMAVDALLDDHRIPLMT